MLRETLTEMQLRIAREMQVRDAANAAYWRTMEKKAKGANDESETYYLRC